MGDAASNRTIVITGASSGIGAAIAKRFGGQGNSLILIGRRNLPGLFQVAQPLIDAGTQVQCIVQDLRQAKRLPSLARMAFDWTGHVDVWVNAAGADVITGKNRLLPFEEKLKLLWEVDVQATTILSREAAARMASQKKSPSGLPCIINLGWDQAEQGMEGDSGQYFSATKGAIMSFSKSLAKSVGPAVRVNCLAPGWIQTAWGTQAPEVWDRRAKGECCLGRWGSPEDVASLAFFIASPQAEFINGQSLSINGGWKPQDPTS